MEPATLTINTGSSSHEYAIYQNDKEIVNGHYEKVKDKFRLTVRFVSRTHEIPIIDKDYNDALNHFLCIAAPIVTRKQIAAIGVRVVAPGRFFMKSQLIDEAYLERLSETLQLAPLHIKPTLQEIESAHRRLPNVPLYAVSDSEFHHSLSHEARNYGIPRNDADASDVYRYGYHGISMASIIKQMKVKLNDAERVIVCHLGSGISITALKHYQSIDNSMGYSTMEGVAMATRSGDIGVEAALHLANEQGLSNNQLIEYLHTKSGLLGLSGTSSDIRKLIELENDGNQDAKFALSYMVYKIKHYIGAFSATLSGIDRLVFTATVGERSSLIRSRVCKNLDYLGINLDERLNASVDSTFSLISNPDSCPVYVIPTDETREIVIKTGELMHNH